MAGDRYGYTTTKITVEARTALQLATVTGSALLGRRVSQSTALLAAMEVAATHPELFNAALDQLDTERSHPA